MSDDPDEELLRRTAKRDERAFAQLFDRHIRAVNRYAWAWSSDRADVQELVQDTFVTAWTKQSQETARFRGIRPAGIETRPALDLLLRCVACL